MNVLKVKEKSRMYLCTFFFLAWCFLVLLELQWISDFCSGIYVFLPALTDGYMGKSNMNWLKYTLSWLPRSLPCCIHKGMDTKMVGEWTGE